jgi:glutaminyl-peptide cyclotransferase
MLPVLWASACGGAQASSDVAFDSSRAWRDLETMVKLGPRPPGSEALEATRKHIESELRGAGLKPVREDFEVKPPAGFAPMPEGGVFKIVCTHFETKIGLPGFVGANDAGSGTAVLLELARVMAKAGPRALTYRFLFLDGEESLRWDWQGDDNTYGSRHHAAGLKKSKQAEKVRCCVLLDLCGDKDLRFLRETYSDRRLNELFITAAKEAGLGKHVDGARQEAKDDHISFMNVGIPSIDLIDFDFGPGNAWWHTVDDTLDKCSAESLAATGRIVLAALPAIEKSFRR